MSLVRRRRQPVRRGPDDDSSIDGRGELKTDGLSLDLAVDIGMIVYVEMALKWNKISGVHSVTSPSQFMALFIALAQLIYTIYRLVKFGLKVSAADHHDEDLDWGFDGKGCENDCGGAHSEGKR